MASISRNVFWISSFVVNRRNCHVLPRGPLFYYEQASQGACPLFRPVISQFLFIPVTHQAASTFPSENLDKWWLKKSKTPHPVRTSLRPELTLTLASSLLRLSHRQRSSFSQAPVPRLATWSCRPSGDPGSEGSSSGASAAARASITVWGREGGGSGGETRP